MENSYQLIFVNYFFIFGSRPVMLLAWGTIMDTGGSNQGPSSWVICIQGKPPTTALSLHSSLCKLLLKHFKSFKDFSKNDKFWVSLAGIIIQN